MCTNGFQACYNTNHEATDDSLVPIYYPFHILPFCFISIFPLIFLSTACSANLSHRHPAGNDALSTSRLAHKNAAIRLDGGGTRHNIRLHCHLVPNSVQQETSRPYLSTPSTGPEIPKVP